MPPAYFFAVEGILECLGGLKDGHALGGNGDILAGGGVLTLTERADTSGRTAYGAVGRKAGIEPAGLTVWGGNQK